MPQRSAARRHLPDRPTVAPALDPPSPATFGALCRRRVPEDLFRTWIHPLRHNPKVRRDLTKYLRNVPKPQQLLEWANQQRTFTGPVLIIWAREDKLMPRTHARRLADHFQNTQLVSVDDSYTLIPIDQPQNLTDAYAGTSLPTPPEERPSSRSVPKRRSRGPTAIQATFRLLHLCQQRWGGDCCGQREATNEGR